MAKNEKKVAPEKDEQQVIEQAEKVNDEVEVQAEAEPLAPVDAPMPVQAQEKVHAEAVKPAKGALLPGRVKPINENLLGEFELALMDAEKRGDQPRAAVINNLLIHIGALVRYVDEIDKKGMQDLYPLIHRVSELFPSQ